MFNISCTNSDKRIKLMRFTNRFQSQKKLIKTLMNLLSISLQQHLRRLILMLKILRSNKQLKLMRQSLTLHYAILTMEKIKKQLRNFLMHLNLPKKLMNIQTLNLKLLVSIYFINACRIKSLKLWIIKIRNMKQILMRNF